MKLRQIFTRLDLNEGRRIPKGYGIAYWRLATAEAVLYPIPINLLVNFHRKIQEKIFAPSTPALNRQLHQAYLAGRRDGFRLFQERQISELDKFLVERRNHSWKRQK